MGMAMTVSMMTECSCESGCFSGTVSDGCVQFKGIRYASSERFCPPVPYTYPEGVHECTGPSPCCPQNESRIESYLLNFNDGEFGWDESCQYLSIAVPESAGPDSKLPVMVWYHGGAYRNGGCERYIYNRSKLAREQNVIVVGVNYRLSVFGFVKDKNGNLANLGLLDSIEGLRWVKQNISSFGGDSDNITIFGQSAGADIVRCIMLSEGTDDLFSKAIIQSDPLGTYTPTRKDMDLEVLEGLNAVPIDASVEEMLEAESRIKGNITEKSLAKEMVYAPHYGVDPLPKEDEILSVLKERAPKHPIIIGSTSREVMAYVAGEKRLRRLWKFPPFRMYIWKVVSRNTEDVFRRPSREFAELYASFGGTVYHYDFDWMEDRFPGPCHGSDLLMVFGAERFLGNPKLLMGLTVQQLDEAGRPMRRIWSCFARDGTVDTTDIEGMLHIARIE